MLRFLFRAWQLKNISWLVAASGSLFAGSALALHHPLWPVTVLIVFWLWTAVAAWRPGAWLFVVPACLPLLNFSPWTGWLIFDEFDILLLGALAGGYGHLAASFRAGAGVGMPVVSWGLIALLTSTGLLGLYRGIADAGGFSFNLFAGYTDALNSLRVFKSLGFALLFVPLLQHRLACSKTLAGQRLVIGIVAGLTAVTMAVLWERAAFPGLLDFSKRYRTVALFWEMHVGGGAIDAYLVLTVPFVVWALICARRPAVWVGAAALAIATAYACLTTFSRGVYFAVAGSLMLLGLLLRAQKSDFNALKFLERFLQRHGFEGWRPKAVLMLMLALVVETVAVLGGSFMTERVVNTNRDLGGRLEHWQHGLGLLNGPADWLFGLGFGRFPANYATRTPNGEFSGSLELREEAGTDGLPNRFVTLRGPATRKRLGGLFALTQRVNKVSAGPHQVNLKVRVETATDVYVELCERHLLYDGNCQTGFIRVFPGKTSWQTLALRLEDLVWIDMTWHAPRLAMLSLSIANAGSFADFDDLQLVGPKQQELLQNGQFSEGLAHWFPAAQSYFVPWHMDNLFLEVLVERGLAGLLVLAALLTCAFLRLVVGGARLFPLSPYLAASLSAGALVGLFSSFMDVPRVAFLYYVLALYSFQSRKELE